MRVIEMNPERKGSPILNFVSFQLNVKVTRK